MMELGIPNIVKSTTHQYNDVRAKIIKLEVKDSDGFTNQSTQTIIVSSTNGNHQTGSMTGNDGTVYKTIKIGTQWWMAENLKETQYHDGSSIPYEATPSKWAAIKSGIRCTYQNKEENADIYGYLYNRFVVRDGRDIAPPGWHVPNMNDWKILKDFLSPGPSDKMRITGRGFWRFPNPRSTNESGFSALPGGSLDSSIGQFDHITYIAYFRSSTFDGLNAYFQVLYDLSADVTLYGTSKPFGLSIRLVKD